MTYKPKPPDNTRSVQLTFPFPEGWAKLLTEVIAESDNPKMRQAQYLREQLIFHLTEIRAEKMQGEKQKVVDEEMREVLKSSNPTSPFYEKGS